MNKKQENELKKWNRILRPICFGDWNCLTDAWKYKHLKYGRTSYDECKVRDECKKCHYGETES